MGTHERWTRLLEILGDRGRISVVEAAEALEVSAATVRRDGRTVAEVTSRHPVRSQVQVQDLQYYAESSGRPDTP